MKTNRTLIYASIERLEAIKPIFETGLEGERLNVRRNMNQEFYGTDDTIWKGEISRRLLNL